MCFYENGKPNTTHAVQETDFQSSSYMFYMFEVWYDTQAALGTVDND